MASKLTIDLSNEYSKTQLKQAENITDAYGFVGFIILVCGLFLKNQAYTILILLYPLLALPIIVTGKGLIKFIKAKKSPYFHVFLGVLFPALLLMVKGFAGGDLLSYNNVWVPCTVVASIFTLLFNFVAKLNNSKPLAGQILLIILTAAMYSFGGVLQTNLVFDKSAPTVYKATVTGHYISHTKSSRSYSLELSPWGPKTNGVSTSVSYQMYNDMQIGSTVKVSLHTGFLHIPWYYVTE